MSLGWFGNALIRLKFFSLVAHNKEGFAYTNHISLCLLAAVILFQSVLLAHLHFPFAQKT